MLNYHKYRSKTNEPSWSRIEMLLALYDGALDRLAKAKFAFESDDSNTAMGLVAKVQLILAELAAGVRLDVDPEMGQNMLRLYEYVSHQLTQPSIAKIQDGIRILEILREGFEGIREQANQLEKSGELAGADRLQMVLANA